MERSKRHSERNTACDLGAGIGRGAFTLVELLVAISILIILTTLTIGAFRPNDNDRISNAAGTFKNAIEGARSRAIKSGQIRGLRLIPAGTGADSRLVTSLVYVGAPGFEERTLTAFSGNAAGVWTATDTGGNLAALFTRNLLKTGNRIEIPAHSGNWYSIRNIGGGGTTLTLAGHYQPSQRSGTTFVAVGPLTYRVELAPTPLPGDPILLPPQTCIDLDGSVLPGRNTAGDFVEPIEILFSPQGTIVGAMANDGVVHFRVASLVDQREAQGVITGLPITNQIPRIVSDPQRGHRAISLFCQTGAVVTSEILTAGDTDAVPNNESMTNTTQAYQFAIRGKETK